MAGCSFLVLEGVDGVRGNALRCSPSAGRRRGRRCAVPRADRGKGAALFSAGDLTWCREVESRALHSTDT